MQSKGQVRGMDIEVRGAEEKRPAASAPELTVSWGGPDAFAREVRAALRSYHELRKLARNPLLVSRLVARGTLCRGDPDRIAALRQRLADAVHALDGNARTRPLHLALLHTYLAPIGGQLLAAERAGTSYGSFRRHLAAGVEEVVTMLWLEEQELALRCLPPDNQTSFE